MRRVRRHDWYCIGGGGGWEVWGCTRCNRTEIPGPFGFMWSDLKVWFGRRWGCPL